jgi:hypothetical protein
MSRGLQNSPNLGFEENLMKLNAQKLFDACNVRNRSIKNSLQ